MSHESPISKILIVGCPDQTHVGGFFLKAARERGLECDIVNVAAAYEGNPLMRRFNWWVRGRVPNCLAEFSRNVLEKCREQEPQLVLSTGIAPVTAGVLGEIRKTGARLCNFLTDDPWNPAHRSRWFFEALPLYDRIFSTRKANLSDLETLGCPAVEYLPFAYEPELHFPPELSDEQRAGFQSDVAFVGGADRDRVPVIARLINEGLDVSLWGGYWKRYPQTRSVAHNHADPETMRRVIASTSCALGLVRKANRDGHAMRTYEVAAIGAPMLLEDTAEHRKLFGEDGERVLYFSDDGEMVEKAQWLVSHPAERSHLAEEARALIRGGENTYADRLEHILVSASR